MCAYMHINNLYKYPEVLRFDEVFTLEKIHGTSAHIKFTTSSEDLSFYSGGEPHDKFVALFNQDYLRAALSCLAQPEIIIYGEAYGGKQQGMSATYGPDLKFVAFDVKMTGNWLDLPNAEQLVRYLKLEFVDYVRGPATLEFLNAQRDRDSVQAIRNGMGEGKKREGIVIRPIGEVYDDAGNRVIAKHKRTDFQETKTPRVVSSEKLVVMAEANAIANEWVTVQRLEHVLDQARAKKNEMGDPTPVSIEDTGPIIRLMLSDIEKESVGEIIPSAEASRIMGSRTAQLFKKYLEERHEA